MTTPTLVEALQAAQNAVEARYGSGHSGITRTAVEAVLALSEGIQATPGPVTKSGWAGIRGDTPSAALPDTAETVLALQDRVSALEELADTILQAFKPRSNGGWNAYAGDKTMTSWREAAGGPE